MAYDEICIGPVPGEEAAASVGDTDYPERSRRECEVYRRMIARLHPVPEGADARLAIKSFEHDLGAYREVVVKFNTGDQAATDYAYTIEANSPAAWDAIAQYELRWLEHRDTALAEIAAGDRPVDSVCDDVRHGRIPALAADLDLTALMAAHPIG